MTNPYSMDDTFAAGDGGFQTSSPYAFPTMGQAYWAQPGAPPGMPAMQGTPGRGFPKKGRGGVGFKQPKQAMKRPLDTTGKTPAQLANEVLTGLSEQYESCNGGFKCILTANAREFHGFAGSKKNAKHEAAKTALAALRPDLGITTGVTCPEEAAAAAVNQNAQPAVGGTAAAGWAPLPRATPGVPAGGNGNVSIGQPSPKKKKMNTPESATTLMELLRALSREKGKNYESYAYDFTDVTDPNNETKQRTIKATLTFTDLGKSFEHTDEGRYIPREMVTRMALRDIFAISDDEILAVVRRGFMKKIDKLNMYQSIQHMCMLSLYKVKTVEYGEDSMEATVKVPGTYAATYTITDPHGKDIVVKGPKCKSKTLARDRGAALALHIVFQVHPASLEGYDAETEGKSPALVLHEVGQRQKPPCKPEYADMGEENPEAKVKTFMCKVTMAGKEFVGSGKSKKEAKNFAANIALKNIYNMEVAYNTGMEDGKGEGGDDSNLPSICEQICRYVQHQYKQMCNFYGVEHSSSFASFVLLNDKNERKLISLGSSPQNAMKADVALKMKGTALIHHDSLVYARRGFVRFLIKELARVGAPDCALEKAPDGLLQLKQNFRLVIVTSQPVDIRYSGDESTVHSLSCHGEANLIHTVEELPTVDPNAEQLPVHTVADKLFKWSNLGVQGALLTTKMHPVLPSAIYTGNKCPLADCSYRRAFTARISEPPFPITVASFDLKQEPSVSSAQLWSRAEAKFEILSPSTGLTADGEMSSCCKYSLYHDFLDAVPDFPKGLPYAEAKKLAGGYISSRDLLYGHIEKVGMGKWQRRASQVDDFSLMNVIAAGVKTV